MTLGEAKAAADAARLRLTQVAPFLGGVIVSKDDERAFFWGYLAAMWEREAIQDLIKQVAERATE